VDKVKEKVIVSVNHTPSSKPNCVEFDVIYAVTSR